MKTKHKAYILIDIFLSITCIMILLLPILNGFCIISKEQIMQKENKTLLKIIEQQEGFIKNTDEQSEILKDKVIDKYIVKTEISRKFNQNLIKYKVNIYKDNILKSEFYIIKSYEDV